MRKNTSFLAHQLARFGAMTIPQMLSVCSGKCGQATIYRTLDELIRERLIKRMFYSDRAKHLFAAKPSLFQLVYGKDHKRSTGINEYNIAHASLVAEALLKLSQYSFVSGIATEQEVTPTEISNFCHSRVPDGIIEVTNSDQSFALAVEVERSRKDELRIDELLEKYRQTFMRQMPCGGLLIIADNPVIADLYQNKVNGMPSDIEARILITTNDGLSSLNQKYFGTLGMNPHSPLEKIVNFYQGVPNFSSMFSTQTPPPPPSKQVDVEAQSQFINEV